MRTWIGALALYVSLATRFASAQPAPATPPPPAPAPGAAPTSPEATPAQSTTQPAGTPAPGTGPASDAARPSELAFGIGFGYVLPASLQTPNITSVRIRLPSGLTFEPQLVFANTSDKIDTGASMSSKQTEIAIASVVHYPLRVHRKVDLELIGSAGLSTRLIHPAGDNNDRTITTVGIGYAVGIAYWLTPHWNLSLSAANPLLTYSRTRQEMTADAVTVNSSTTIGLVFSPEVTLMLHLFD